MKKNTLQIVPGILAGCITFESCGGNLIFDESADDINSNIINNQGDYQMLNSIAVNTIYQFEEEDLKYISFLEKLANDIINNEEIASLFIKNPQAYITKHGFEKSVNMNPKITNCILALADKEICQAALTGNVGKYIELLESKGFIKKAFVNNIDNIYTKTIEQGKGDKLKSLERKFQSSNDEPESSIDTNFGIFAFCAVVGAIVVVWAVAVEHVAAANAVSYLTALVSKVAAITKGKGGEKPGKRKSIKQSSIEKIQETSLLSVWQLKNHSAEKTYIVTNELTEKLVNDAIKIIRNNNMKELENISDNDLRNFILLNLQTYDFE